MAFGGVEKISSGFLLVCDRAGGTSFETVPGLVDVNDDLDAGKSRKTKQASGGKEEYLPSLRARSLRLSFRWDQMDATAATTTHAELLADFITGVIGNWKITYPGTTPNILTRTAKAFISELDIPHVLGETITASITLQVSEGAFTDAFI